MKKNALFMLIISISFIFQFSSCSTVYPIPSSDPFAPQLDALDKDKHSAERTMIIGASCLLVGVLGGSLFSTMKSLGSMDSSTASGWLIFSYIFSSGAAGTTFYGFMKYNTAMNEYLETLRLQTQYYNTLTF